MSEQKLMNAWEMRHWNPHDGGEQAMRDALKDPIERRYFNQVVLAERIVEQFNDGLPPDDIDGLVFQFAAEARANGSAHGGPQTMTDLIERNKELRPVVINPLARVGEVVNIVAPSKRGKSWLVLMLLLCIVVGKRLFDTFTCTPGKALLIDNELHPQTSAYRVKAVAKAMGLDIAEWGNELFIDNVRGRDMDIHGLVKYLEKFQPGDFSVIVLDALYRFYPKGFDENSNADMTWLYNVLDGIANRLQCVIVCIVHSSKGNQSEKSLVDVGSGAGAMARAPDCHIAIREHEERGCVVFEGTARSFPPIDPICLRWSWPLWVRDDKLDPSKLFKPGKRGQEKPIETVWTAEMFATTFGTPEPQLTAALVDAAVRAGAMTDRKAAGLIRRAAATGKLHKWPTEDKRDLAYATVAPPDSPHKKPAKRQRKGKK